MRASIDKGKKLAIELVATGLIKTDIRTRRSSSTSLDLKYVALLHLGPFESTNPVDMTFAAVRPVLWA